MPIDVYRSMTHGSDESIVQGLLEQFEAIRKRNRWSPAEVYEYARVRVRNAINTGRTDRDMRRNLAASVDRLEKRIYLIERLMKPEKKPEPEEEQNPFNELLKEYRK